MTWIKICGTTNLEDARLAVDAGADALGFVFAESPRQVTPELAREIIPALPEGVEKVGVFVDETVDRMMEAANQVGLTAIQLHGDEPSETPRAIKQRSSGRHTLRVIRAGLVLPWWKDPDKGSAMGWDPVPLGIVDQGQGGEPVRTGNIDALLVDSGTPQKRGGTGTPFDWTRGRILVTMMASWVKVIVAGGLTPANVAEAIRILRPWGVDVATGVEREPGKKDPEKVRAFIEAVRQADKEYSRL
ncbi:MAG TPA: phosphoribosylanthranilate isomerase [Terriglobales bacterium]|nr:phosphoribosylanthranilate isomerase [Terriglobales bacterium]